MPDIFDQVADKGNSTPTQQGQQPTTGDVFDHVEATRNAPPAAVQPEQTWLDKANASVASDPNASTIGKVGRSLGRLALMPANIARTATAPYTPDESLLASVAPTPAHGLAAVEAKRFLYDPSEASWNHVHDLAEQSRQKIETARQSGQVSDARAKELLSNLQKYETAGKALSAVPFLGPLAMGEGEQAGKGDVAGTITDIVAPAAIAEVVPRVARAARGVVSDAVNSKLAPIQEPVGDTNVTVRNSSKVAKLAEKVADPEKLRQFAIEKTGAEVAKGVGNIAKDATGVESEVTPTRSDRFGINDVAEQKIAQAKSVFQKIDEASGNKLSDLQRTAEDYAEDTTGEGKAKYREAIEGQEKLFDQYKNDPALEGEDVLGAKKNYSQGMANRFIAKALNKATEASETGNLDYQLKQGNQLASAVDDLVKNRPEVLKRAGWTDEHITQAQRFGQIVREQAVKNPDWTSKVTQFVINKVAGKVIGGSVGYVAGGPIGAVAGLAGAAALEHASSTVLGSVLTNVDSLRAFNAAAKGGVAPTTAANVIADKLSKSDPSLIERLKKIYQDSPMSGENGEINLSPKGVVKKNVGDNVPAIGKAVTLGDAGKLLPGRLEPRISADFQLPSKANATSKAMAEILKGNPDGIDHLEAVLRAAAKSNNKDGIVTPLRAPESTGFGTNNSQSALAGKTGHAGALGNTAEDIAEGTGRTTTTNTANADFARLFIAKTLHDLTDVPPAELETRLTKGEFDHLGQRFLDRLKNEIRNAEAEKRGSQYQHLSLTPELENSMYSDTARKDVPGNESLDDTSHDYDLGAGENEDAKLPESKPAENLKVAEKPGITPGQHLKGSAASDYAKALQDVDDATKAVRKAKGIEEIKSANVELQKALKVASEIKNRATTHSGLASRKGKGHITHVYHPKTGLIPVNQ